MIEVTREAPANLGTAMKTIIARFEDMKKDPNALIDGASANKVEAALATIGIALRDTAGEFRPLQDVMDELGMKWNTLTRNQQAYIATVAAGSRQQSRFLALMNNYDRTLELVAESQNSAGAAAEQYAIYQDSAAAATARLSAAWEEFYNKIVNSEQIIWVIDNLTKLVETMSKIGPVASAIGASIGALGLQTLIKGVMPEITKNLATAATTGTVATFSFTGLAKGAGALVVSLGKVIAILGAVALAITAVVAVIKALDKAFHADREEAKQLSKEIKELNEAVGKSTTKADSLKDLMDRYDELNKKVYRTKEEQEELNKVIEDIAKISNRAVTAIKENGDAHLYNANSIRAEIEEEERLAKYNANRSFDKTQKLMSNKAATPEDFRQAGMIKYADWLEDYQSSDLDHYRQLHGFLEDPFKNYNFSFYSQKGLTQDQAKISHYQNMLSPFGDDFESLLKDGKVNELLVRTFGGKAEDYEAIKSLGDFVNFFASFNNQIFDEKSLEQRLGMAGEAFEEMLYGTYTKDLQKAIDIIGNSDKSEEEKLKGYNNALRQEIFKPLSTFSDSAKAFNELMLDGLEFTAGQMDDVQDGYEDFYSRHKTEIDEYLQSDRTEADVQKLIKAINDGESAIGQAFVDYAETVSQRATEEATQRQNRREQFIRDNLDYLGGFGNAMHIRQKIRTGDITESEQAKMQDLINSQLFDKDTTFSLFDIFVDSDDELDKKIDNYVKKLEAGLFDDADKIKQEIIQLLSSKGIEGDLEKIAEDLVNLYVTDIEGVAEKRLSQVQGDYISARAIYEKDPQEALTDKEYEFLQGQNININRYIEINDEGEKYLNILGKITVLEKNRAKLATALAERIEINKASIEEENKQFKEINDSLENENENQEVLNKNHKQTIQKLESENSLLQKQLDNLVNIVDESAAMSLNSNLSQAEKTYDNINKIGKALGEAQQNAGQLSLATARSLLALDDAYYEYMKIVDGMVTLDAKGAEEMRQHEEQKYQDWLNIEKTKLEGQKILLQNQLNLIETYLTEQSDTKRTQLRQQLLDNQNKINQELSDEKEGADNTIVQNGDMLERLQSQWSEYYNHLVLADAAFKKGLTEIEPMSSDQVTKFFRTAFDKSKITKQSIDVGGIDFTITDEEKFRQQLEEEAERIAKKINILSVTISQLENLSPAFKEAFKKGVSEAVKGGKEAVEDFTKAIDDLVDALEDLDNLLKDVKKDLDDINIDYNPFMELFEAWEHEWDYYYNIKNLINLLDQQGTYLDNIISASYTSATEKLNAYDAKVGNITAKMAANDAYITTLRAGIAQQALELERKFGQYYNVDNVMGGWQIFQKDTNLTQWNEVRDAIAKTSYELNKLINEQENELNLNESIQDALEEQQDAYQSILDTVEDVIDSLSDNENITVDLSELNSIKEQLEKNLEDGALDAVKKTIKELNDYIQELQWQVDLNDNVVLDGIDDAFDDMEDGISHVQELIDALNDTIAEQQELLENLTEIYDYYIDTAISTQQELYDAIIENYQNEINKKKEQYDYLKKLDNDYLNSIKNNISKERQAREDANKQKSYQQSLQRAQLLQMDTSGAFRSELASLNKEIESQRQDLYDDLVDKQVDALEEEIKKRQELYDLELTALEERLAYYQENAILLWEMVNQIVADGAEAMMATLENTIDYVNSNELTKERQRTQWELSIRTTLRGVVDGEIENLKARIEKGNEYIKSLDEIQQAISKNTETYQQTSTILIEQNADFQAAMDAYMQVWTDMTNGLTGYYADWKTTVSAVKSAMEADIEALEALGEDGGGIKELEEKLRQSAKDMYNSFIEERKSYANQLQKVIKDIETRISAAVTAAANAIKNAAGNIQVSSGSSSNPGGGSSTNNPGSGNSNTPTSPSPTVQPKKYKISFQATGINLATGETEGWSKTLDGFSSEQEAINAAITFINNWLKQEGLVLQKRSSLIPVAYAKGGMADFTGPAWLDGSPSNPERILSPKQTKLFESMVSSLEQASNNSNINSALGSSYNIGDINTTIQVDKLDNDTDINRLARQVEDKIMRTIRNRVTVSVNKGV